MGGNYPPGTSAGDPRAPWNAPDRSHDHEWRPGDMDNPVIEDGAAIFHEQCQYAEGRHGEGWECEETRTYRFEYSTLESPSGVEIELHDITEWEENDDDVAEKVVSIEEAFHNFPDEVTFDIEPDPDCGQVTITYEDWGLHFRP
jgi:hypothetical protein